MIGTRRERAWPVLMTDEEAERFLAEADLTEFDFAQMVPVQFDLRGEDKAVSLRLSDAPLEAVKRKAARQGIPYQRFIRQAIEQAVAPERHGSGNVCWRPSPKRQFDANWISYNDCK